MSTADPEAICPTYLLDDSPSATDDLSEGGQLGPHSRIAKAIADLICSGSDGGKMVGIEGGWGAGKTTVIELLSQHFGEDQNVSVVVFDAWAHRGDPLRRTFLESLVACLRSSGWLTDSLYFGEDAWKNKIDSLAKRRRQWTKTTIPKTTPLGTWFAISALLVPLGIALVSGLISRGVTIDPNLPILWDFALGVLLSAAPLVLAFAYWANERLHSRRPSWELVSGKGTVVQQTEETNLPDPTSLEFEDHFDKLMNDLLSQSENRRLILVLDNLDRVDASDALDIWSTLQTFLQFGGIRKRNWFTRLWIIVPYDSNGLRRLWENNAEEMAGTQQPSAEESNVQYSENSDVAASFIDKSFQIRFELPPPVLSSWRQYLQKLVTEALPRHEDDVAELCRVYSIAQPNYSPTPRELKLFVNQIGMVHRQWPDHTFPISHIAYYTLLRRRNIDVSEAVINLPDPEMAGLLPTKPQPLQESLAGLAFNVEPALGMQIALRQRMFRALTSGQAERVTALATGYPAGFWALLDDTASMEIREASPKQLEQAIRCSMQCDVLLAQSKSSATAPLFRQLAERIATSDATWPDFDGATGAALAKLGQIVGDRSRMVEIADSIRRTSEPKGDAGIKAGLLEGIFSFVREIDDSNHSEVLSGPFPVGCTAEDWIKCTPTLVSLENAPDSTSIWPRIKPTAEPAEIAAAIAEIVTVGEASSELVSTIRITHASAITATWPPVLDACRNWLDLSLNQHGPAVGHALEILIRLRKDEGLEKIRELVEQGHLLHALHHDATRKDAPTVVRALVAMMMIDPSLAKPEQLPGSSSDSGYQYLETVLQNDQKSVKVRAKLLVDLLFNLLEPALLFDTIKARGKFDPLLAHALRLIADNESQCSNITTDFILSHWPEIVDEINDSGDPERMSRLLINLIANASIIQDLLAREFAVEEVALYAKVIAATPIAEFVEACVQFIRQVSKEDWANALRGGNNIFELVLALESADASPHMPHSYLDALVEFAEEMMRKAVNMSGYLKEPIGAYKFLNDDNLKADFRRQSANDMIGSKANITDVFFNIFGKHMTIAEPFQNDSAVSELFSDLVTKRHTRGLTWLRELMVIEPKLIESAARPIANSFRARLKEEIVKNTEDEAGKLLIQIAEKLGLQIPDKADSEDEKDDEHEPDVENNSGTSV